MLQTLYKHSLLSYILLSGSQISSVCFNTHALWISSPACLFFLFLLVLLLFLRWLTIEEWFNQGECLFLLFLCLFLSAYTHVTPPSIFIRINFSSLALLQSLNFLSYTPMFLSSRKCQTCANLASSKPLSAGIDVYVSVIC